MFPIWRIRAVFLSVAIFAPFVSGQQHQPLFQPAPSLPTAESHPTPEPSTWALLVVAIVAIGYALRARRRESSAS